VRGQQLLAVARAIGLAILTDKLAERCHGRPAVSSSSALAARSSTGWVRWV
jgi:hypothetical protein